MHGIWKSFLRIIWVVPIINCATRVPCMDFALASIMSSHHEIDMWYPHLECMDKLMWSALAIQAMVWSTPKSTATFCNLHGGWFSNIVDYKREKTWTQKKVDN